MKYLQIIFILFLIQNIKAQNYYDSLKIVKSLPELEKIKLEKNIVLRTYDIRYSFYYRKLELNDKGTILFLDQLVKFLKSKPEISKMEIGIHVYRWNYERSSFKLDSMWEEIISYLVSSGIEEERLVGFHYYSSVPLPNPKSDKEKKYYSKRRVLINNRVEFKILEVKN